MGKVHGSLARAGKLQVFMPFRHACHQNSHPSPGKVKSQTPKVEAQEKPKTPKGRAHKREIYTHRFVNVVTGPGGKCKVRLARPHVTSRSSFADISTDSDERQPLCLKVLFGRLSFGKRTGRQASHGVPRRLLITLARKMVMAMGKVGAQEHGFDFG